MQWVATIVLPLLFGGADQYLGGLWSATHIGFWTVDVSQLSAVWLALPFIFGARQSAPNKAILAGTVATLSALLGYFAMTLSPAEGVSLRHVQLLLFARSQLHVVVPAIVSGPLFGFLGWRWRSTRSWLSGAVIGALFIFEPVARGMVGNAFRFVGVTAAELAIGFGVLGAVILDARRRRDQVFQRGRVS
jgi:hypothetical protein